jgi:hypothetical protein
LRETQKQQADRAREKIGRRRATRHDSDADPR